MTGSLSLDTVSTRLHRIAELARQMPDAQLTNLAHHIDVEFLRRAYELTRKDGAAGIDGRTAKEYAQNLEGNLESLLGRFKSGTYRAPAVRRVHIPKGTGKTRPIGIPTVEDKVLQRAVSMVLTAVYEQDFSDCSYGFRPDRSAHQALQALWDGTMSMGGGWVVELDIEQFFDTLDRKHLRRFLDQRVRDGVIRRTIDKWLKAGVVEDGRLHRTIAGTPQGGVVSPLLANIYLHHVLDLWFQDMVKPALSDDAFLIRYADDAVMVFRSEHDARRVLKTLPKRFAKFGLRLHPEKTRLIPFRRPPRNRRGGKGEGSFDLLGFTHYWEFSQRGSWILRRKTSTRSLRRSLHQVWMWCRRWRHLSVAEQCRKLGRSMRGHYGYFGITGNSRALGLYRHEVRRAWRYWLARRGQRRTMPWSKFLRLEKRHPLPAPRIVHVYRFAANP